MPRSASATSASWPRWSPPGSSYRCLPDAIAAYLGGTRTIGGGLITNGEIFRGAGGGAGQFGHQNVDPSGPECWCGRSGCLESLAGPAALLTNAGLVPAGQAREVVDRDPEAALATIFEAAGAGEKEVLGALEQAGTCSAGRSTTWSGRSTRTR